MADADKELEKSRGIKFDIRVNYMRMVETLLARGDHVDGHQLADALRDQAGMPIPAQVLDYLCRYLEGHVHKPRGRKPLPLGDRRLMQMLLRYKYQRYLPWLQKRRKRDGHLDGWSTLQGKDWWQGPPNERAARMAAHSMGMGAGSWRRAMNLISSLQKSAEYSE